MTHKCLADDSSTTEIGNGFGESDEVLPVSESVVVCFNFRGKIVSGAKQKSDTSQARTKLNLKFEQHKALPQIASKSRMFRSKTNLTK